MICKHQLALCKLHDCQSCGHVGEESRCPQAYIASLDEAYPTFAQMASIYRSSDLGSRRHREDVIRSVEADIARVGLTPDSRCVEMTRSKFKLLVDLLLAPLADGSVRHGDTIQSHLAAFRSLASERLEDRYEESGLELPTFSVPKLRFGRAKVQEVSDRTIRKVEIEMEKWLATGRESDRSAYVFCFFALYCGMRAGDICRARWNLIRHTTAGVMIVYTPHKTAHSSGVTVSFPLDNRTYVRIEPLVGAADEYVIPRHGERAPAHVAKTGEYAGFHGYLRAKVNRMLSLCGIGNEFKGQKKAHALRKYFETDRVFQVGKKRAADECGHTVRTQERNYLGTLVGKVS